MSHNTSEFSAPEGAFAPPASASPPGSQRRAVIDIGTNSVKLLVADVAGSVVHPVWEESEQTRLGRGFYESQQLQPDAIADTARAVAGFVGMARTHGVESPRVIATSAARDARNRSEFIETVERAAGAGMTVISGRQEAEWVYQGVTSNPALAGLRLLIMDVGGGSTEFILSSGGQARACHSHPLGAVRMLELLHPADPPSPEDHARCRRMLSEFIVQRVAPDMHPGLAEDTAPIHLVGTGGSATILARMEGMLDSFDRDGVESARLSRARVTWWMNHLWSLPLAGRRRIVGLPKKRADVILTGGSIYEAVMDAFGISEMRVSTRGLRYAAVMAEAMPEGA